MSANWDGSTKTAFSGSGTVDSPYAIATEENLAYLAQQVNSGTDYSGQYFKLTADLNLSKPDGIKNQWTPIGNPPISVVGENIIVEYINTFEGTFDGDNHTISNLYNNSNCYILGLFSVSKTDNAIIKNIGLINVDISGNYGVGGLVGLNEGTIENCYATGTVRGDTVVGGLVGSNKYGIIKNCYATSDVNGTYYVGGLVGENWGTIENCYATSDISRTDYCVGGLVGWNGGAVTNSVALNQHVNRTSGDGTSFGRVVGYNHLGTLNNNYAWEGMLVKGEIVTSSDEHSKDGKDLPSTNVWDKGVNEGIWETLTTFTSANWTKNSYENFKLLILTGSTNTISDASYLKPLKVTYNGNGNTSGAVPTDANGYSKNKEVTVSENTGSLEKTDYIFGGWSKIQNGDAVTKFTITEDTTLYAKWLQQFNVTFNNNSGTGTMANQTFVEGISEPLNPNEFTKDGYDFIGWALTADGAKAYSDKQSITISADKTLYAVWQIKSNPTPQPINSGGSTDTGSGNYKIYERSVTDGGYVSFGSSPYVIGVELPKGSNGQVILTLDSDKDWLKDDSSEYLFDISVHELGDGTAEINFKLSADKLEKLGLSPADICLYHSVNGQWVKLETEYEIGADGYVYYTAYTDSFSPFKIVVEEGSAVGDVKETVTPVETKETEAVPTYVEPSVPSGSAGAEKTASPMGVVGLITGIGVAVAVLRRK